MYHSVFYITALSPSVIDDGPVFKSYTEANQTIQQTREFAISWLT